MSDADLITRSDAVEMMTRQATFRPASFDAEKRTVRVTVSTGAVVRRRGYDELLALPDPKTIIDLPVLNTHRRGSLEDVLGRVVGAGQDGEGLWADVQISERHPWVLQGIEAGEFTAASIGYGEAAVTESTDPSTGRKVRTVTPEIREISFVPIPADPGARVRADGGTMEDDEIQTLTKPDDAERQRRSDIRTLVRSAGLDAEVADELIDDGADVTKAKAAIFDKTQERRRSAPVIRTHQPQNDDPAMITRRHADAMAFRMAGGELPDDAREFVGMTMKERAAESLTRAGISTRGMNTDELLTRAGEHSTSDFPNIVANAINKVALSGYQAAESPMKRLSRQRLVSDFKDVTSVRVGE
ncbi:MAG: HK97 family phage prohead protease, partial [Pseudomonadota bacterium]